MLYRDNKGMSGIKHLWITAFRELRKKKKTVSFNVFYSKGLQSLHTKNIPKDWFFSFLTVNLPHSPTTSPVFCTLVGSSIIYPSLKA